MHTTKLLLTSQTHIEEPNYQENKSAVPSGSGMAKNWIPKDNKTKTLLAEWDDSHIVTNHARQKTDKAWTIIIIYFSSKTLQMKNILYLYKLKIMSEHWELFFGTGIRAICIDHANKYRRMPYN